jgi:hypothetical protein
LPHAAKRIERRRMEAVETLFPVPALGRRIIMLERF